MLQSTRRRRSSKNDYEWAEREKKRLEQNAQELKERTRATQVQKDLLYLCSASHHHPQEAARKKVEDTEKKVKEEAEKLVCSVCVLSVRNKTEQLAFLLRCNNAKKNMTEESKKLLRKL